MPRDQGARLIDQRRHGPASLADRRGDLSDLRVAVHARIARIGDQTLDRPALDAIGWPLLLHQPAAQTFHMALGLCQSRRDVGAASMVSMATDSRARRMVTAMRASKSGEH